MMRSTRSLTLAAAVAAACVGGAAACDQKMDYSFLLLVQQWPPSYGKDIDHFTLHGNWPSRDSSSYPCYCTDEKFDVNKVDSIESRLDEFWPSLEGSSQSFWSHEYTKHGTCAENIPALKGGRRAAGPESGGS